MVPAPPELGCRDLLAQLLKVNDSTLGRAVRHVALLANLGCMIPPSTARFRILADLTVFLANNNLTEIKSTC
ncbi:hypothetical protein ACFYYI_32060 [Streptomyces sp. NPDC002387]|uniref:hypothetical protein n=1 Tax=Streptomyces sp. NPDC002387 TaxID=3364643 RepID=UPI0036D09E68